MAKITQYYYEMKDGTVKQINPFTGTEVWAVPGRANRPISNVESKEIKPIPLVPFEKEMVCDFCSTNYLKTPPEKERIINTNGSFSMRKYIPATDVNKSLAYFRRCSNLFEIISFDYWEKNYSYTMSNELEQWKESYLSTEVGKNHVLSIIQRKMQNANVDLDKLSDDEKLDKFANPLFGGCHDLIISGRHYSDGAQTSNLLCSAGSMSPEEHYQYIRFTIYSMKEIFRTNRFANYISVFQNWLAPAGASVDHLHRQLVGLDEWGTAIENEIELARKNRNVFNEYAVNFAAYHDLIIAENDYAIAFASFGHRFPTIAIYSRSANCRPMEHTKEEIQGVSDLIHACHAAMGPEISCNEEWYYQPPDALESIPWHILIKWRVLTQAGFEGGTRIHINPISPKELRDRMIPRLYDVREKGLIAPTTHIAEECRVTYNPLEYYKNSIYF